MSVTYIDKGATLSDCGTYRYHLWREWREGTPAVVWIMLNPSTADGEVDDLTIRKCVGFADRWGYGRIDVVNLYPLRATNPADIWKHAAPEGPSYGDVNLRYWASVFVSRESRLVAAWGNHAPTGGPTQRVCIQAFHCGHDVYALGTTKAGAPRHPSRLAYDTPLVKWRPR